MLSKLLPVAKRVGKQDETRTDAKDEGIDEAVDSLGYAASTFVDSTDFASATRSTADKAVRHSKSEFDRIGIKLRKGEPKLDKQIAKWRRANVDLVKTMLDSEKEKLRVILATGEARRYESLAKEIQERCDITKRHAEFIARDQTLKLNSNITHSRMTAAGITRAVWVTTGDERVRPEHEWSFPDFPDRLLA